MLKISFIIMLLLVCSPVLADTFFYCIDNTTLRKDIIKNVTIDTTTKQLTVIENTKCQYGCFNNTILGASCGKSEETNTGFYVAISIVILIVIAWVYKYVLKM